MQKILFILLLSLQLFAGVFDKVGVVDQFQWAPDQYTTGFKYDVYYYIPQNFDAVKNQSMIFMHGGGSSTMTREGSARVAKMYIDDLKALADQLNFIIVSPSGSGLNWGGHTRVMIRDLAKFMRSKLSLSANKMVLAGHSMGGMGITRNAHWLIDQFAAFLPMAAGMDPKHATEENLQTYFNTYYHHLQGLNDHFTEFITRCQNQEREIQALEAKYGQQSGFVLEFYNGSHNYQKPLIVKTLNEIWKNRNRTLNDKILRGSFYFRDDVHEYNGIKYNLNSTNEYKWLEALEYRALNTDEVAIKVNFTAMLDNNIIDIQLPKKEDLKKLRVYLSDSMIDFYREVEVLVNGELVFKGIVEANNLSMDLVKITKSDNEFNFQTYLDIAL